MYLQGNKFSYWTSGLSLHGSEAWENSTDMVVFESWAKSVVGVQAKSADCVEIMIPQLLLLAYVY